VAATQSVIEMVGENSHAEYWRIHSVPLVHVTYMGKYRKYCCLTDRVNVCEHTQMVKAKRERAGAP
jgi:hypothetical protein